MVTELMGLVQREFIYETNAPKLVNSTFDEDLTAASGPQMIYVERNDGTFSIKYSTLVGFQPVWVGDPAKATAELGWRAEDDLPTGFAALADWLRDHRDLWLRYEIEEG